MSNLRSQVLKSFRTIHKTRLRIFEGDERALEAGRIKINEEYKKNKHISDEGSIKAMIKFAEDVENELRTQVIQAKEVRPGVYEARIRDDTVKLDNTPFNDAAIPEGGIKGKSTPCCQKKDK